MFFKTLMIAVGLAVSTSSLVASTQFPKTEEELDAELLKLDWQIPGTYQLPNSHSTISLPAEHVMLLGKDAKRFSDLMDNTPEKSLEAITIDDSSGVVYFDSHNEGYVSLDDWDKVDPHEFLQSIVQATKEKNKERRKHGTPELHVIGWLQEPTLDRHNNTVYWAIEAREDGHDQNTVNSTAIRLGRKGFERVVWVTEKDLYKTFGGELDVMLRAHSFDPGYRYIDYTKGDKLAHYGIAALVAATVGAKVVKAAGGLILLKKLGGVLAAIGAAVLYKFKNLFRRKKSIE